MFKDAPKYFKIFSSVQGCSARSILGAIGRPKGSPTRHFSHTVVAVLLFSRRLEFRDVLKHMLFCGFLKIRKCCFSIQLQRFYCFSEFEGSWSARNFSEFGGNRGLFSQTVVTVLRFSRVLALIGNQRNSDHPKSSGSSKASSKVLDLLDNSSVALIPRLCNFESPRVL